MRTGRILASAFLTVIVLAGQVASLPSQSQGPQNVAVEMRNIYYHFTSRIAVHISQLDGEIVPSRENSIPIFDDPNSFYVAMRYAKISISSKVLSAVMNDHVFAGNDAPLKDLSVSIEAQRIKVKGKLHSKGDIPFETESSVSLTSQGKVRLHAEHIKAAHLPMKGLMELLGLHVSNLINTKKLSGVEAEGDDLILDPGQMFPPPQIRGKLSAIQIQGDELVQVYGVPDKSGSFPPISGNYMAYRGNQLRFGKLTMSDSDMILIDMDPKDAFDFYLDHYREQLSAGYTKITRQFGLRVYMRDFNKLQRSAARHSGR